MVEFWGYILWWVLGVDEVVLNDNKHTAVTLPKNMQGVQPPSPPPPTPHASSPASHAWSLPLIVAHMRVLINVCGCAGDSLQPL